MADGAILEKSENHHISATGRSMSTKFGTATQFDVFSHLIVKRLKFCESKMAAAAN